MEKVNNKLSKFNEKRGHVNLQGSSKFVKGAAILAFTGLTVKFIGLILKIILGRLIGDDGIGLYMYAYPVFSTLLIIATAGVPVAVSKLVAEKLTLNDYQGALKTFKVSLSIMMITGFIFSLMLALSADYLSENVYQDPRAYWPLLSISPAIFLVTIMASLRGFFQGQQNMSPTALSQLIEQLFRVIVSIGLIYLLIPLGIEYAAAGATFGAVAGALAGLITILVIYIKQRNSFKLQINAKESPSAPRLKETVYRIGSLAAPVMVGSMIIPITNLIDSVIVPARLPDAGLEANATALFGQLLGFAGSIIHLPIMLGIALTMSMVPAVSEANALQNHSLLRHRVETSQRLALIFSIPSAAGLFLLSDSITLMLFDNETAGFPLSILAWSVIFTVLYKNTTGIHQGLGKPGIPVINMLYGGIIKIAVTWLLTGLPAVNIGGAALGTVLGTLVAAILNIRSTARLTGFKMDYRESLFNPLLATVIMGILVQGSYLVVNHFAANYATDQLANTAGVIISVLLGALFYSLFLMRLGTIKKQDIHLLPGKYGKVFADWLEKTGWLKS